MTAQTIQAWQPDTMKMKNVSMTTCQHDIRCIMACQHYALSALRPLLRISLSQQVCVCVFGHHKVPPPTPHTSHPRKDYCGSDSALRPKVKSTEQLCTASSSPFSSTSKKSKKSRMDPTQAESINRRGNTFSCTDAISSREMIPLSSLKNCQQGLRSHFMSFLPSAHVFFPSVTAGHPLTELLATKCLPSLRCETIRKPDALSA